MSTNWLVSTGSVSCYYASMMYQHWATQRHKIRCLTIQKLKLSRKRCMLVYCFAGRCKS